MRFKKGELTKESFKVIMHDLECLALEDDHLETNNYHLKLLKDNLKDLWGIEYEI